MSARKARRPSSHVRTSGQAVGAAWTGYSLAGRNRNANNSLSCRKPAMELTKHLNRLG